VSEGADVDSLLLGQAIRRLQDREPARLVDDAADLVREMLGGFELVLYLLDYRLASLRPLSAHGATRRSLLVPCPVGAGPAGLAYREQRDVLEPVPAGSLVHVPLTLHGQRFGVLCVTYQRPPGEGGMRALRSVALALSHLLVEAARVTDAFEAARRHGRLSVAAELQWQLLPARAYSCEAFTLAGHLEPALRVSGNAFDFSATAGALTVVVADAAGHGQQAALASTLAITALRNARRAGLALAEQASLADQAVFEEYGGRCHVSTLLMALDVASGAGQVVDAGSPLLLRQRHGRVQAVEFEAQLPLGLLEGSIYSPQPFAVEPGDRLLVLTEGALAAPNHTQGAARSLVDSLLAGGRDLSPGEIVRRVVAGLLGRTDSHPTTHVDADLEIEEDATVMCVDWHGGGGDPRRGAERA